MKTKLSTLALACIMAAGAQAQEVSYEAVTFERNEPAVLAQFSNYTTFDVSVITTQSSEDAKENSFDLPYQIKVGNLKQVDSTGDFHIITLVQKFSGKFTSASAIAAKIHVTTTVFTRSGEQVFKSYIEGDNEVITLDQPLTKEERNDQTLVRKKVFEKIIAATLRKFEKRISGGPAVHKIIMAELRSVKKYPELQEFTQQKRLILPAVAKGGLEALVRTAEPFVPYWEKMTQFSGSDKANEVKRAAYQNLVVYHIAANNLAKAREYIELYKPIDKTVSELFGLVKYKNSEECALLIDSLYPAPAPEIPLSDKMYTKAQMVDAFSYMTMNGTVKVNGKKIGGTYTGQIRIRKLPPPSSFGSIISLDPENTGVTITTVDANGKPKVIETAIAKLESITDEKGNSYVVQKFGIPMLGDGTYYVFMGTTYTSPKIQVYRTLIPADGQDYLVKKAGDEKGVKSTLVNARKNLEEYLSDCSGLAADFKSGAIGKNESLEKIAERYTACQ